MLWQLMDTGRLSRWWDYVLLEACMVVLSAGPILIYQLWPWRKRGDKATAGTHARSRRRPAREGVDGDHD